MAIGDDTMTREEYEDEVLGMGPIEPQEINADLPEIVAEPANPERPF